MPGTAYVVAGRTRLGVFVTGLTVTLLGAAAYVGAPKTIPVAKPTTKPAGKAATRKPSTDPGDLESSCAYNPE